MTRVKFLVFALVALGLWLANLTFLAPALSARAVEQATKQVAAAPAAVALKIEGRRVDLQRALLKVAGSPAALAALKPGTRPEAPTAEKLAAVKTALAEALPEAMRPTAVVALANEAGSLWARGDEAPSSAVDALDVSQLSGAGGDGAAQMAFGASHLFFSFPVLVPDRAEAKSIGTLIVGAPMLPENAADEVAADLRLAAVAIAAEGKQVQSGGPEKASLDKVEKAVKPGAASVVARGSLGAAGPFTLPMATSGDTFGGNAPLSVGLRQAIGASPFEVIASASLTPFMQTLADYQKSALLALGGLLFLTLAFTLILGAKAKSELELDDEQPAVKPGVMPPAVSARGAREAEAGAPLPMPELPPVPEASPDDFQFGPAAAAPAQLEPSPEPPEAAPDPFAEPPGGSPFDASAPAPGAENGGPPVPNDFDAAFPPPPGPPEFEPPPELPPEPKTRELPAYVRGAAAAASADPFAMAAAQSAPPFEPEPASDYNPDATRVATIPQELLKAAARPTHEANPMVASPRIASPLPKMPSVSMATAVVSPEDQHFHEVYRDFVATRERCGEASDGLNYDKFALKLKKNREQLMAKHSCRTVRFQVYVKEGKAALKATPIKE